MVTKLFYHTVPSPADIVVNSKFYFVSQKTNKNNHVTILR